MKLSEALREGRKTIHHQMFGSYLRVKDGELCGCVLGTIAVGAGHTPGPEEGMGVRVATFLRVTFPELGFDRDWAQEDALGEHMVDLNDGVEMTFDEFQTWLEGQGQ